MKRFRHGIETIAWLLLVASTACGALSQHDWVVRLADSHGARSPTEPLRLHLPDDMPQPVRAALIYKLDGIDITAAVTVTPDDAILRPPKPLAPGGHRLRLIYAPTSGRWRELGVWGFNVVDRPKNRGKPAANLPSSFLTPIGDTAELELNFAQPVSSQDPPVSTAVQSYSTLAPDYREHAVQPLEYISAKLSSGPVAVQLGRQKLTYESLIHKDLERNGTTAHWTLGDATRVLGFGMRTPARTQLNGVVMEHRWPIQGDDRISLVGGWISGNTRATDRDDSAWSLAGDASLLTRRLRIQLEYAGSHSEDDTDDNPSKEGGPAYKWKMELRSRDKAKLGWRVGAEQSRVAPLFVSLANPALATDRLRIRTYGDLTFDAWRLDWSMERWRNNLEQDVQISSQRTGRTRFAASWAPADVFGLKFFGRPTYKLATDYRLVRELAAPVNIDHMVPDSRALDLMMQTKFSRGGWLWGINAKSGRFHRVADAGAATRSVTLDLYGDFTAVTRLPAKPVLSWRRKVKPATGVVAEKWLAKLTTSTIELRDDLRASVDMELARWVQSDLSDNINATRLGGSMVWTLQRPHTGRNGLALTLSGSYSDAVLTPGSDVDDYRLMISLSTTNPLDDW